MPQFRVPAKITVRVDLFVEALGEADALTKVNRGDFDDETWAARCEIVDAEATGSPQKDE